MPRPVPTFDVLLDRFLDRIQFKANDCWLWLGYKDRDGYGYFFIEGKNPGAHRTAFTFFKGPIDNGLHVLHTCDNPSCVNPEHLFVGTNADNVADKMRKKRHKFNPHCKLSEDQVVLIKDSTGTQSEIARRFGINQSQVSRIKTKQRWKHIGGSNSKMA